jgi:hypothetical protein
MKVFIDVYISAAWYNSIRREEESSGAYISCSGF